MVDSMDNGVVMVDSVFDKVVNDRCADASLGVYIVS